MAIKYFSSSSLSFLSLFHPVPKQAVFAALQAEYTLCFFIWCRYRSLSFSTKQDMEKRTNSLHYTLIYIFHKHGGILGCLIKIEKIFPELSSALISIMTRVIECDLQHDKYFGVPKPGVKSSKFQFNGFWKRVQALTSRCSRS